MGTLVARLPLHLICAEASLHLLCAFNEFAANLIRNEEVSGSIPLGSTNHKPA